MVPRRRSLLVVAALGALALALFWPLFLLGPGGYMPHGMCYLWQPGLVWLHVTTDGLIGLAYLVISLTLAYLVWKAHGEIPFHWMILAFGAFIIACGATHWMEVWTLWRPDYWVSGNVKLMTAVASVGTAIALPPLVPRVLDLVHADRLAEDRRVELAEREIRLESERTARAMAEAAQREAAAANRSKDQFLAMVSHELRGPLSPILAWSSLLKSGRLDPARTLAAVQAIERNARAQAQLIEDLLDVSRIVSGKLRLDVRPTELADAVGAAVESVEAAADAKQIRLDAVLDPQAGLVSGDAERLRQVAWNLVSNAVKFTPHGGRVQVRLQRVESEVELVVSDTGKGISAEILPHVFDRFEHVGEGTGSERRGLGLGLAIVRHLVELHGGTVEAASEGPNRGATFRVRLPLLIGPARVDGSEHPTAATTPVAGAPPLDGLRVLVVDDEPDSNEAVQVLLSESGAEVRVAGSAEQAIQILGAWRPDVLVSDIDMPDEDGYVLLRRVRALDARAGGDVPAVALTAYGRVEDRVRALTAGFAMHVVKPAEPAELAAVVARVAAAR